MYQLVLHLLKKTSLEKKRHNNIYLVLLCSDSHTLNKEKNFKFHTFILEDNICIVIKFKLINRI